MEYISGIYSSMMGNTKEQPETYRGLLAADEYGTRRIRQWVNSIVEPALEQAGKVFKEIAQFTYTTQKVFIGLSSGYDSGAISCELLKQNIPFKAYSVLTPVIVHENRDIIDERQKLISESGISSFHNFKIILKFCFVYLYYMK